jgi:hypothetical protein
MKKRNAYPLVMVYPAPSGGWRWRALNKYGRVVESYAANEAYAHKSSCMRAARKKAKKYGCKVVEATRG